MIHQSRRALIGQRSRQRHSTLTSTTCRSCSKPIPSELATKVTRKLRELGCSDVSLSRYSPVCSRCLGILVQAAVAQHEASR